MTLRTAFLGMIFFVALGSAYFKFKFEGPVQPREVITITTKVQIPVINEGMQDLSDAIKFTQTGAKEFFMTNPQYIADKNKMAELCAQEHSKGSVLGCYYKHNHQILILQINEDRLKSGIINTGAHETLHAIYDGLPQDEKAMLNAHLKIAWNQNRTYLDERLKSYKFSNTDHLLDEVHSILGTEVEVLSTPLETHYQKYFIDRNYIIQQSNHFRAQFSKRLEMIARYDAQILEHQKKIEQEKADNEKLQSEYLALIKKAELAKQKNDVATYSSYVPEVNHLSALIQSGQNQLNNLIQEYNQHINQRNAFAQESNDFASAIDTRAKESGSP